MTKEETRAYMREWHKNHPVDKARKAAYFKEWSAKNRAHINEKERERYAKDPSKRTKQREKTLTRRERALREKEAIAGRARPSVCDICSGEGVIVFDHDHKTGKFRGWVCYSCNVTLGHVRDSVEALQRMIDYLKKAETLIHSSVITAEDVKRLYLK